MERNVTWSGSQCNQKVGGVMRTPAEYLKVVSSLLLYQHDRADSVLVYVLCGHLNVKGSGVCCSAFPAEGSVVNWLYVPLCRVHYEQRLMMAA